MLRVLLVRVCTVSPYTSRKLLQLAYSAFWEKCPLLAQSRHSLLHRTRPLSGVKRTLGISYRLSFEPLRCPCPALRGRQCDGASSSAYWVVWLRFHSLLTLSRANVCVALVCSCLQPRKIRSIS